MCTVPIIGVLESEWDIGSYAMEAKILRPLLWFGLLEYWQLVAGFRWECGTAKMVQK
jgi:hypothetical protein